jgi:hypothetical protein
LKGNNESLSEKVISKTKILTKVGIPTTGMGEVKLRSYGNINTSVGAYTI